MILRIALWISLCAGLAGCKGTPPVSDESKSRPVPVTVLVVEAKDVPVEFDFIAQTQSSRLVDIQARVSGFLDRRVYTEGEIVKEGQVLFEMDKKPFIAQLNAAEAALARQQAAMETARLNLDRTKPLAELKALSQKDLDNAIGSYETTAASVEQAKAQLELAKLNLSYCTITSPLDGITSAALQQDGSYLDVSNSKLTTVSRLSPIWVNFSLSENQIQSYRDQVKKGLLRFPPNNEFVVKIVQIDGTVFPHTGKITFAEPYFNPQTGTFLIRASVENPHGILLPFQYVHALLTGAVRPNAIAIPQKAVQQSSKGMFVWVIDERNEATFRPVVVGDWHGDDWFILEGLRSGDHVVVDGGINLSDRQLVTVSLLEQDKKGN